MKRSNITNLLLILMFLAGVSLLLYPSISDYWNSFHSSKAISNYVQKVDEITEEDYERMIAEVKDYNKSLLQRNNPYALTDEMQRQYDSLLNLDGTGVMGYVEIPVIDCSIPVYHTVEERVLQKAIGHLSWTSLPMGGKDTHCALSGHRGLPNAKLFSDMDKIVEGDRFYLYILNEELVYEVDQILIVNPEETEDLLIVSGKDYCTLVTCTPYGVNTHRLLVRGKRIENDNKSKVKVTSEALQVEPLIVATVLAIPMLLLLLIWLFIPKSKKERYRGNPYDANL